MNSNNNNNWKTLADIQPIRTREPKEMLGKYLAENAIKHNPEDFIDESTGEVITIDRTQIIFERGTYINDMKLQEIMFAIQAEEIEEVAVCEENTNATRFISGSLFPFEVTLSQQGVKRVYLVRATSPEAAIECLSNYAPLYGAVSGYYSITSVKHVAYTIIEDTDEVITCAVESNIDTDIEYYKTICRFRYYSEYDERMDNDDYTLIVKAHDVGEAKTRSYDWMFNYKMDKLGAKYPHNSIIILKAQPYSTAGIIPHEYCDLFIEKQTEF